MVSATTFYVAFGKWPDPSKPVFKLPNSQVPTEENIELLDTLKDMHQKAFDGELSVWGKRPMTVTSLAVPNALFKPIPKEEWDKHRVEYMDLINPDTRLVTAAGPTMPTGRSCGFGA